MFKKILWVMAVSTLVCNVLGLEALAALKGSDDKSLKDIYYFVIDRSGSIGDPEHKGKNSLVIPVRGAVIDFVGKLSQDSVVEMVFFSTEASAPKRWESMDYVSKGELTTYFYEQFIPKEWTRLYDTSAEVIERAKKDASRYRSVNVIIISDGNDQGPPDWRGNSTKLSTKHTSWASVEKLAKGLKISNPNSLTKWITLGSVLGDRPPIDGEIVVENVADPQKGVVITVAPAPKAEFTCSPSKVQVNDPVLFVLESEIGVEKAQWSFGDGGSSTSLKPHHAFAKEGTYSVKVTVSGAGGENTATKPNAVQVLRNVPLEASFKWSPQTVRIHQKVQLVDESIGSPDSWAWEVTGLASMYERSPTLEFDTAGTKTVTLTIGKEGQKHSVSKNFDVLPPAPIKAGFKWSPDPVRVGEKVQFVDASLGSPDSWSWEFTGLPSMSERSPIVEFAKAGPVTATLTIEKDGQKNSESLNFEVLPLAPLKAAFKWSPEKIRVGDRVQFVDESLGSPESWSWEFSGQQQSNDKSPATAFNKPGPVTVSLTVGKDKRTDTNKQTFEVLPPPPPSLKAAFSISPAQGICPLEVQFKDASQGAIASYRWDFGDGQFSDVKDPKHTYQKAGSWTPRLTIRNAERQEARDTGAIVIAVSNPPPPPPWWKKPLIYAIVALAVWILLIVPFVLKPVLAPQPKVAFRGPSVYFLRNLAARGITNFLWPRSSVAIGTGKVGDIKMGGVGQKSSLLAKISRVPLSSNYTMTVLQTGAVSKIGMRNDGLTGQQEVQEPLPSGRTVALRQGDAFTFTGNTRLTWEQPSLKKIQQKK